VPCACGAPRTPKARECLPCRRARLKAPASRSRVCGCGNAKAPASSTCVACYNARQRHGRAPLTCEWCGVAFWRKPKSAGYTDRDARRFCSKRCNGDRLRALAAARNAPKRQAEALAREMRAQYRDARRRLRALRRCPCGAPPAPTGRYCVPCRDARRRLPNANTSASLCQARALGVAHCCPNCGTTFQGLAHDVYCSTHCRKQYKPKYPRLRGLTLDDRNRVAALIALVREARRYLNSVRHPESELLRGGEAEFSGVSP